MPKQNRLTIGDLIKATGLKRDPINNIIRKRLIVPIGQDKAGRIRYFATEAIEQIKLIAELRLPPRRLSFKDIREQLYKPTAGEASSNKCSQFLASLSDRPELPVFDFCYAPFPTALECLIAGKRDELIEAVRPNKAKGRGPIWLVVGINIEDFASNLCSRCHRAIQDLSSTDKPSLIVEDILAPYYWLTRTIASDVYGQKLPLVLYEASWSASSKSDRFIADPRTPLDLSEQLNKYLRTFQSPIDVHRVCRLAAFSLEGNEHCHQPHLNSALAHYWAARASSISLDIINNTLDRLRDCAKETSSVHEAFAEQFYRKSYEKQRDTLHNISVAHSATRLRSQKTSGPFPSQNDNLVKDLGFGGMLFVRSAATKHKLSKKDFVLGYADSDDRNTIIESVNDSKLFGVSPARRIHNEFTPLFQDPNKEKFTPEFRTVSYWIQSPADMASQMLFLLCWAATCDQGDSKDADRIDKIIKLLTESFDLENTLELPLKTEDDKILFTVQLLNVLRRIFGDEICKVSFSPLYILDSLRNARGFSNSDAVKLMLDNVIDEMLEHDSTLRNKTLDFAVPAILGLLESVQNAADYSGVGFQKALSQEDSHGVPLPRCYLYSMPVDVKLILQFRDPVLHGKYFFSMPLIIARKYLGAVVGLLKKPPSEIKDFTLWLDLFLSQLGQWFTTRRDFDEMKKAATEREPNENLGVYGHRNVDAK